jgi:hypothetical protein
MSYWQPRDLDEKKDNSKDKCGNCLMWRDEGYTRAWCGWHGAYYHCESHCRRYSRDSDKIHVESPVVKSSIVDNLISELSKIKELKIVQDKLNKAEEELNTLKIVLGLFGEYLVRDEVGAIGYPHSFDMREMHALMTMDCTESFCDNCRLYRILNGFVKKMEPLLPSSTLPYKLLNMLCGKRDKKINNELGSGF